MKKVKNNMFNKNAKDYAERAWNEHELWRY
jgi:hypothetical protein